MTINSFSAKLPFGSDLRGKSGTIYEFYSYGFDYDLDVEAKNIPGLFYISKIEGNSIVGRTVLKKTKNIFEIRQIYKDLVPNIDDYSYLIYEGKISDLDAIISDVNDNGDIILSLSDNLSDNISLIELKAQIKNKTFMSTNGIYYEFIPENTLRLKDDLRTAVHYEINEEGGKFILNHSYLLGTEPILIEVINNPHRLELTMSKYLSGDFIGTWIEQ